MCFLEFFELFGYDFFGGFFELFGFFLFWEFFELFWICILLNRLVGCLF